MEDKTPTEEKRTIMACSAALACVCGQASQGQPNRGVADCKMSKITPLPRLRFQAFGMIVSSSIPS
jgi:hypothetical protein